MSQDVWAKLRLIFLLYKTNCVVLVRQTGYSIV